MNNNQNFAEKQLGLAYWYVTHKLLLKNIFVIIAIIFIIILAIYNLASLTMNLAIYRNSYQNFLNNLITFNQDLINLRQFVLPQPIQTANLTFLPNKENFDIIADIANPNKVWSATFDYQFKIGEELSNKRSSFILPSNNKKLIALAVKQGNLASQIVFSNLKWYKEINFAKMYAEKYQFEIKNLLFIPSPELGVGDKLSISRVSFELFNKSAYNYNNFNLLILLNSGGALTAVNQIAAGTLLSNQTKKYDVNFFQQLPKEISVEIVPDVNILDERSFLKF
jgi:hypothetical protein